MTTIDFIELAISNSYNYEFKLVTTTLGLMEILVCPQCKQPVKLADDEQAILCPNCHLSYPVRDDIPVMLIDEAEQY